MNIIALLLMPASINQMLFGGNVIFSAIFSIILLKKKLGRNQYLGVFLTFLGFFTVGVAALVNDDTISQYSIPLLLVGICMSFTCCVFEGASYTLEEWILEKTSTDCQRMVGIEGVFGIIWVFNYIFILSYIPCPSNNICDTISGLEDPISALLEMSNNKSILMWSIIIIFAIIFFNLNGLILTKNVSCIFRVMMDALRTGIVWGVSLAFG